MSAVTPSLEPCIDFPGRRVVTVYEIASALRVAPQHVTNLVEDGTLSAYDLNRAAGTRRLLRVSIEEYRRFLACRLIGPGRIRFLEALPIDALRDLHRDTAQVLARRAA